MKLIFLILSILFLILSISYGIAFVNLLNPNNLSHSFSKYFLIGVLIGSAFWLIFSKSLKFFAVFEHELTHMLVGILFFQKPRAITASEGGGMTVIGGNFLVVLAPYFLPTFSYLALPFYFIIKSSIYPQYFLILGIITGYHIISTIQETKPYQTDLQRYTLPFSYSFSIFGNIIFLGYLFYFSEGEGSKGFLFLKNGFLILKNILKRYIF